MERDRFSSEVARFTEFIGADEISQWDKFREEVGEVLEETDARKVGMELVDVIIVGLGLIHCMGLNFEELFDQKMRSNFRKYGDIQQLKASGMDHQEAQQAIRDRWIVLE